MSKITKLLVLLLALVMVVSVFAGCGPDNQPDDTKPQGTEGDGSGTVASVQFPLEEPVTFKMAVRGQKEYQELMENCEWYKYLCEKTNVFIDCVVLGDDPVGKLNTLLTSNNAPDMVLGPVTLSSAQVITLADQGYLLPLDDYVTNEAIMPNYQRLLKDTPQALAKMVAPDGNIWSVAGISNSPASSWESPLTVNIEWLKQVPGYEDGKTFPKTVEEFTEVLRYFKKNDMNGNGLTDDEIPLLMVSSSDYGDAQATLQGLMNLWGLGTKDSNNDYYVHIPDDNVVTLAPCTENYRDCLKWVNIWYEEGLIWDRFFEKTSSKDLSAVSGNATDLWGFFNGANWFNNGPVLENRSQPWGDAQVLADPFYTGYDVHYFLNPAQYGNLNSFMVFSSCKQPEVLLSWYDMFLSLDGTLNTYRGMINEWERYDDAELYKDYYTQFPTWYKDETGKNRFPHLEMDQTVYKDLAQYDEDLDDQKAIDHPTWSSIFGLNAVFKGLTSEEQSTGQWPEHEYSEAIVLGKWIEEHPDLFDYNVWPRPYSTADEADELAFLWPDVRTVITEYQSAFITGDMELNDANWEAFQEDMKLAGSEDLIAILQAMWDRQLETKS